MRKKRIHSIESNKKRSKTLRGKMLKGGDLMTTKHKILNKSVTWDDLTETEKEVDKVLRERWVIGRKRYGEGISFKQARDPAEWVQQAIEECADQLQYLVALKLLLKERSKDESYLDKLLR